VPGEFRSTRAPDRDKREPSFQSPVESVEMRVRDDRRRVASSRRAHVDAGPAQPRVIEVRTPGLLALGESASRVCLWQPMPPQAARPIRHHPKPCPALIARPARNFTSAELPHRCSTPELDAAARVPWRPCPRRPLSRSLARRFQRSRSVFTQPLLTLGRRQPRSRGRPTRSPADRAASRGWRAAHRRTSARTGPARWPRSRR